MTTQTRDDRDLLATRFAPDEIDTLPPTQRRAWSVRLFCERQSSSTLLMAALGMFEAIETSTGAQRRSLMLNQRVALNTLTDRLSPADAERFWLQVGDPSDRFNLASHIAGAVLTGRIAPTSEGLPDAA